MILTAFHPGGEPSFRVLGARRNTIAEVSYTSVYDGAWIVAVLYERFLIFSSLDDALRYAADPPEPREVL